jgi:hypothetical protein
MFQNTPQSDHQTIKQPGTGTTGNGQGQSR